MSELQMWCRVTVFGSDGTCQGAWSVWGPGAPTVALVDQLARRQLAALRAGSVLVLSDTCPKLRELLDFLGLGVELGRKAEGREEMLNVEESVEPGDPPT
jgi:hypothetical protein